MRTQRCKHAAAAAQKTMAHTAAEALSLMTQCASAGAGAALPPPRHAAALAAGHGTHASDEFEPGGERVPVLHGAAAAAPPWQYQSAAQGTHAATEREALGQ